MKIFIYLKKKKNSYIYIFSKSMLVYLFLAGLISDARLLQSQCSPGLLCSFPSHKFDLGPLNPNNLRKEESLPSHRMKLC